MAEAVETERLRLEPWDRRTHAAGLAEVNADAEVMQFINGGVALTRVESQVQSEHRRALADVRLRPVGGDRDGARSG